MTEREKLIRLCREAADEVAKSIFSGPALEDVLRRAADELERLGGRGPRIYPIDLSGGD